MMTMISGMTLAVLEQTRGADKMLQTALHQIPSAATNVFLSRLASTLQESKTKQGRQAVTGCRGRDERPAINFFPGLDFTSWHLIWRPQGQQSGTAEGS